MLPTCRSWSEITTRGPHPARARGLSDAGPQADASPGWVGTTAWAYCFLWGGEGK